MLNLGNFWELVLTSYWSFSLLFLCLVVFWFFCPCVLVSLCFLYALPSDFFFFSTPWWTEDHYTWSPLTFKAWCSVKLAESLQWLALYESWLIDLFFWISCLFVLGLGSTLLLPSSPGHPFYFFMSYRPCSQLLTHYYLNMYKSKQLYECFQHWSIQYSHSYSSSIRYACNVFRVRSIHPSIF